MLFGDLVKERSNFANFCIEIQNFDDFGPEGAKIWQLRSIRRPTHANFDVEFSLTKGAILTILSQKLLIIQEITLL